MAALRSGVVALLCVAAALCVLAGVVDGAHNIDAKRMLQYEIIPGMNDKTVPRQERPTTGEMYGSMRARVNMLATSMDVAAAAAAGVKLARNSMVVVTFEELLDVGVSALVDDMLAEGLLVVLPADLANVSDAQLAAWAELERALVKSSLKIPVYFTYNTAEVEALVEDVARFESGVVDNYKFVVSGKAATAIGAIAAANFEGVLTTQRGDGAAGTIAVLASHDAASVAPGLAFGADNGASGTVALLEVARLFAQLYDGANTDGAYNLLFVLTGASRMQYAGVKEWLASTDNRILSKIDFALCIDAIGGGRNGVNDKLRLHISRAPKDDATAALYNAFAVTARNMDIDFETVHKKISLSKAAAWPHEQLGIERILSATLSEHDAPAADMFGRVSLFDTADNVDDAVYKRNIEFVARALARIVYGIEDEAPLDVFAGGLRINNHMVDAWMAQLARTPRMLPYIGDDEPYMAALLQTLADSTSNARKLPFTVAGDYRFYDGAVKTMEAFQVKTFVFDFAYAALIVLYCGALYVALKGREAVAAALSLVGIDAKRKAA